MTLRFNFSEKNIANPNKGYVDKSIILPKTSFEMLVNCPVKIQRTDTNKIRKIFSIVPENKINEPCLINLILTTFFNSPYFRGFLFVSNF